MHPVLVASSHGTGSPAGRNAVGGLIAALARRRPDIDVRAAFVDVQRPTPLDVLGRLEAHPARLVPLLLSAGYHVFVDLTEAAAASPSASLAPALGPDLRLAELLRDRLVEAGLRHGDVIVMAAAGSSEPSAVSDCEQVARALSGLLDRPVTAAYLSAVEPRVDTAVAAARASIDGADGLDGTADTAGRRVVVATYLLAPGYFADLTARSGADVVSLPLLRAYEPAPDALVDIVIERFLSEPAGMPPTPPPGPPRR